MTTKYTNMRNKKPRKKRELRFRFNMRKRMGQQCVFSLVVELS